MPRKGKKRREAARARREATGKPEEPLASGASAPEAGARRAAARPRPAARERHRGQGEFRAQAYLPAAAIVAAIVIGIGVAAWLVFAGGSSGNGGSQTDKDPFEGMTADVVLNIQATGSESSSSYIPTTLTAKAGQLIEIVVQNVGSVSHNLHVSGADKAYDTLDDCLNCGAKRAITYPQAVEPGKEGHVFIKLDQPGAYPFKCDFHPDVEKGNLIIE